MSSEGSITLWIAQLKAGDTNAAQPLWDRYFSQLVRLAQTRMAQGARRVIDEEDIALAALNSFCNGVAANRFPQLHDRDNLWALLVVLTARKASNAQREQNAKKRGGGKVKGESVWLGTENEVEIDRGIEQVIGDEPTPAFAAEVAEEFSHLLGSLQKEVHREVAVLKTEGYTNEEIASKVGVALRTVERRLDFVRKHLCMRLAENDRLTKES